VPAGDEHDTVLWPDRVTHSASGWRKDGRPGVGSGGPNDTGVIWVSHPLVTVATVRLLHTSDWHLGRLFHGASLHREQEQVVERIAELVAEHRVDAVLIAGDIYDRAVAPSAAVALFDDALVAIREAGAAIVAITGNHDSSVRVGFGDRLLATAGVTIRGDLARGPQPVVLPPDDGGPPVVVYPIPYLDPLAVAHHIDHEAEAHEANSRSADPGGDQTDGRRSRLSHDRAMAWALDRARHDLASRGGRSVVVAHTFVNGAAPSDSERELTVGSVDLVGLGRFDGFHYVALGHLHRPQSWDDGRVAYSGSPLPYSFSEEHHPKSVRLVDLAPDGSVAVQVEPLAVGRPLRTLEGELDHLLRDRSLDDAEAAFVRVLLTDRHLPIQAMSRIQQRFGFAVELQHTPTVAADAHLAARPPLRPADTRRSDPLALSVRFLDEQRGFPADPAERELLGHALDDAHRSEAS
jgi:exonuclease SbcD